MRLCRGDLPQGTFGAISRDILSCHNRGRGRYWRRVGEGLEMPLKVLLCTGQSRTARDLILLKCQALRLRKSPRNQRLSKRFAGELIKNADSWAPPAPYRSFHSCERLLLGDRTHGHLAGAGEAGAPRAVGRGAEPRRSWDVPGSARGSRARRKKKPTCVKCLSLPLSQASNRREHATTHLSAHDD